MLALGFGSARQRRRDVAVNELRYRQGTAIAADRLRLPAVSA